MNDTTETTRSCPACRKGTLDRTTIEETIDVKHDGRKHSLSIAALPVLQCNKCSEILFDQKSDSGINAALRDHLGLLSPAEILNLRESNGLTQQQLADLLSIAPESLSRWENEKVIQSRSSDKHLRLFFKDYKSIHTQLEPCEQKVGEKSGDAVTGKTTWSVAAEPVANKEELSDTTVGNSALALAA